MRTLGCVFSLFLALVCAAAAAPPETRAADQVDEYHGVVVEDPYRWLEDADDPEVMEWVERQNRYTRSHLDDTPVRDQLVKRLTELWNYPRYSAPSREGERYFYFKNDGLQDRRCSTIAKGWTASPGCSSIPTRSPRTAPPP